MYVISPEDEIVTLLEAIGPTPADSVYLTLDKDLQYEAQLAIKDFTGAIVVLERDTGRILSMVSSPGFNPNASDPNNFNSQFLWDDIITDPDQPFFNRATQGQYPPGSIFKLITLAAALESGMYTVEHEFFCGADWSGLPGTVLEDWTASHDLPPSGQLTLLEGLMRSCNPYYYDIGLSLYSNGFASLVADTARGFGLGSATNLDVLPEATGQITNPNDNPVASTRAFEAVQQAFGQGTTLITPLQAAVYVAAIGNGGTLYKPQIIERIESISGFVSLEFAPESNGSLPVTPQNLAHIQNAMSMVVANPRGTAYRRFGGLQIPVSGKTGTASVSDLSLEPHAWFIGYTTAGREDLPDIAIAVLVENVGDGSDFAAPIFRRILEVYFFGRPQVSYPWESRVGVLATPEPEGEEGNGDGVVQTPEP